MSDTLFAYPVMGPIAAPEKHLPLRMEYTTTRYVCPFVGRDVRVSSAHHPGDEANSLRYGPATKKHLRVTRAGLLAPYCGTIIEQP